MVFKKPKNVEIKVVQFNLNLNKIEETTTYLFGEVGSFIEVIIHFLKNSKMIMTNVYTNNFYLKNCMNILNIIKVIRST